MTSTRDLVAIVIALAAIALVAAGCASDGTRGGEPSVTTGRPTAASTTSERVTLTGTLTLDGRPLEARFLGARVVRDGLTAACQATIPSVSGGAYSIQVYADAEVRGCGARGAEVLYWAHDGERFVFSGTTLPWPEEGAAATFDAAFVTSEPEGASEPVTELKARLFDREGAPLPDGSVAEAYAGNALCGITSLRSAEASEGYVTLIVAGPTAVADCAAGATLTFRIDGQRTRETAVNDLRGGPDGRELDLTLE